MYLFCGKSNILGSRERDFSVQFTHGAYICSYIYETTMASTHRYFWMYRAYLPTYLPSYLATYLSTRTVYTRCIMKFQKTSDAQLRYVMHRDSFVRGERPRWSFPSPLSSSTFESVGVFSLALAFYSRTFTVPLPFQTRQMFPMITIVSPYSPKGSIPEDGPMSCVQQCARIVPECCGCYGRLSSRHRCALGHCPLRVPLFPSSFSVYHLSLYRIAQVERNSRWVTPDRDFFAGFQIGFSLQGMRSLLKGRHVHLSCGKEHLVVSLIDADLYSSNWKMSNTVWV